MTRARRISALALLFCCCAVASAQPAKDRSDVLKELLSIPAPTPITAELLSKQIEARPERFFDKTNVPPDDAPLEDLIEYWSRWSALSNRPALSDTVLQRLLNASADDVAKLHQFLPLLPATESVAEKVKQALDNGGKKTEHDYYREEIKKWLVYNSNYFVNELVRLANKVMDNEVHGAVDNDEALVALAKIDWSRAAPTLDTLVNTGQPRSSTFALTVLYQHSLDEKDAASEMKFREKLQAIAANQNLPGWARNTAINTLSVSEWSGRDEWYATLFSDVSLILLRDGFYGFSPLNTLFTREPDKWIPWASKAVGEKDKTLQQTAATCLVRYANDHPRRDAILPVLRWLTEPAWIPMKSASDRAHFVQTMDELEVPESIPGLIWIVENDKDNARWAASTLAHYKDARAIPALKKALAEAFEDDRAMIIQGLLASGGLTEAEQVAALEEYAARLIATSTRNEAEIYRTYSREKLPIQVSIGRYLARQPSPSDALVRAVLTRATSLRKTNETLGRSLVEITRRWQGREIDLDLIRTIAVNTADANTIVTALKRRASLRESVETELHLLVSSSGAPKGIGAVLLESAEAAGSILTSSDQPAQIALLASARLTQTPLPVDLVGPLLKSRNSLLATAAERYLLAEDSKQARTLLWQHHPNAAFITGWRENIDLIAVDNLDPIVKLEEKLRAELLAPGGPQEIFALLTNYEHNNHVLRVYSDKAAYTYYEDAARYRDRVVPKEEVSLFKGLISTSGIADRGPQFEPCYHNCWVSQVLMLSRDMGRRVLGHGPMDNTPGSVLAAFERLGTEATTHYNFEKEIKGLEVLYSKPNVSVVDVWLSGGEVRILVELWGTEETTDQNTDTDDEDDENARAKSLQRQLAFYQSRFSWRTLKDKDANSITVAPEGYWTFDQTRFPVDENDSAMRRDERQVKVLTSDSILLAKNFEGLWKQTAGTKAVRISGEAGAYMSPVVTPDGKWVVVSKADKDWSSPNYLVRLSLETGREYRVDLEPAHPLDAIAYLPLQRKVLLRRIKDEGQDYYLIDPQTGALESASGEFAPLQQQGKRFLQATEAPGEYWAAMPDETKNQTVVGRYQLKDFSFKPVVTVPQISFDSMSMWVDEKSGKLYLVYKDQLLRLPLKSSP